MGIGQYIGKKMSAAELSLLTDDERRELLAANAGLRHYGFGPFKATIYDGTSEVRLSHTTFVESQLQGAVHILIRALRYHESRGIREPFLVAAHLRPERGHYGELIAEFQQILAGLANYEVSLVSITAQLEQLGFLSPRFMTFKVWNNRNQLVYTSGSR